MTRNPYRCDVHAHALAGWECSQCGRKLCPDCVAEEERVVDDRLARYQLCVHCDVGVERLTFPGSAFTFGQLVFQSIRLPPRAYFFALLAALYVIVMVAQAVPSTWAPYVWGGVVSPLLWTMFFLVLQAAARGAEELEGGSTVDLLRDVVGPTLNAALLSLGIAALMAAVVKDRQFPQEDAAYWAVSLGATLALPSILLTLAMRRSLLVALWPGRWVHQLVVLGRDGALLVGITLVIGALAFGWVGVAYTAKAVQFDTAALTFELLAVLAWMVEARLLGLLLRTRGGHIGYPFALDQRVVVMDAVMPRGVRKAARPPPRKAAPAPIELDPDEPAPTAADLPALAGALERGDLDAAVALYAALPSLAPLSLSISSHLAIGQAAAARGNLPLAVRALETAASAAPDHPDAPRACVILARVYAERLSDAASADRLFRYVVERYPGTPAARFAQDRLGATG